MPTLSRWYIKTALLYLVAALLVGIAMAGGRLADAPVLGALWTTYLHLFVVGWLTQLIIGVAIWLFPRHSKERPHGNLGAVWAAYYLLNVGLMSRAIAEPFLYVDYSAGTRWVLASSAVLQWIAVTLFVAYIWSRVRTK